MSEIILSVPDCASHEIETAAHGVAAREVVVRSQRDSDDAGNLLVRVAATKKGIVEALAPAKSAAHAAHKAITALEARLIAPLDATRTSVQSAVIAWQQAERLRVQREQADLERVAREQAEAAALEAALEAEALGDDETAAAIIEQPQAFAVAAPIVAPPELARGVSMRTTWSCAVTDLRALLAHVLAHPECTGLVVADMQTLNALARAQKGHMSIPGVKVLATESLSVRGSA